MRSQAQLTMLLLLITISLLSIGQGAYVPGTPGAAWSREEILAVRAKIRLTFHKHGKMPEEARKGRDHFNNHT